MTATTLPTKSNGRCDCHTLAFDALAYLRGLRSLISQIQGELEYLEAYDLYQLLRPLQDTLESLTDELEHH